MNLKIFSVITGILIAVIVILGGTYYYLFEYSKPKSSYNTYNNNVAQTYNESPINNQQNQNNNYNNYTNNSIEDTQNSYNNVNTISNSADINTTQSVLDNNQSLISTPKPNNTTENKIAQNIQQNQTETKNSKKETSKPDNKKQELTLKQEKINHNKNTQKNTQTKKLSTAQEYLSRGKDSRLEPKLSTESMKVYVLNGKFLTDYRINLLKEMLTSIENTSKDYNLSVFVQMLPKNEMRLTIYNKDIIFSEMRKAYKHISIEKIQPFMNNLEELNSHVAREEVLERLKLQIKKDGKGSDFAKHIKSLTTGLNTAQYFFPFCEVIEITSINP